MRRLTGILAIIVGMVCVSVLAFGAPSNNGATTPSIPVVTTYIWTISGKVGSGVWNGQDLTGRSYVLRISSTKPVKKGASSGFGLLYGPSGAVDVQGIWTQALYFSQIEQSSHKPASDTLFLFTAGGPNGGTLELPKGVLGNPEVFSIWGPVQVISGGLHLQVPPDSMNPTFVLNSGANATTQITVFTKRKIPVTLAPHQLQ